MEEPKITTHPRLKKGEHFLGNVHREFMPDHLSDIPDLALRVPAYSIYGEKLPWPYQALIALNDQAASAYNRRMEARVSAAKRGVRS